jgi:hypothetical protein
MSTTDTQDLALAIVPIVQIMPELREKDYAEVIELDASRMLLHGLYEAKDGEYLARIRDILKPRALWTKYLEARGIPYQTALDRIHKVKGHVVRSLPLITETVSPAVESVPAQRDEDSSDDSGGNNVSSVSAAPNYAGKLVKALDALYQNEAALFGSAHGERSENRRAQLLVRAAEGRNVTETVRQFRSLAASLEQAASVLERGTVV